MGDDDQGGAGLAIQGEEHVFHDGSGVRIEIAGWLVGEKNAGAVNEGAGERNALLFPAAELHGKMIKPVAEADFFEELPAECAVGTSGTEFERDEDVLQCGEGREQLEILEHEADEVIAEPGASVFTELC